MVVNKPVRQKPKIEARSTLASVGSAVISDIRQSLNSSQGFKNMQNKQSPTQARILLPHAEI